MDTSGGCFVDKPLQTQLLPAFFDDVKFVGFHITEDLQLSTGPMHLDSFSAGSLAQTEMQTEVALGNVAAAAANFLQLLVAARAHCNPRADGVAVGLCANELQRDPASVFAIIL